MPCMPVLASTYGFPSKVRIILQTFLFNFSIAMHGPLRCNSFLTGNGRAGVFHYRAKSKGPNNKGLGQNK